MFSTLRKLILLVLGIPFVILGTRFLLDAGQSYMIHHAAASWTPMTVELVSVEHFSSVDQALGNQTLVHYRYEFKGQPFEGQFSCIGDECPQTDLHLSCKPRRMRTVLWRRSSIPASPSSHCCTGTSTCPSSCSRQESACSVS
jgi:hypothetical protein